MAPRDAPRVVHHREQEEIEFSRIVAFSDGVFAIAITLLVLALEIPAGSNVGEELRDRADEFFAYFLSFAVVGRFWISHHRFFGAITRFDTTLLGLNLAYLAFIALLPFTSEVLGDYSNEPGGVALYAANLTFVSVCSLAIIRYAVGRRLMRDDATEHMRYAGAANLVVTVVFAASIPIAFLSPTVATISWASLFFLGDRFTERLVRVSPGP